MVIDVFDVTRSSWAYLTYAVKPLAFPELKSRLGSISSGETYVGHCCQCLIGAFVRLFQRNRVLNILICAGMSVQLSIADETEPRDTITIKDLVEIRDIVTFSLSPDGRYIAYQVRQADWEANDYYLSNYVANMEEPGESRWLANGGSTELQVNQLGISQGNLQVNEIAWSPDSQWIYFTKNADDERQVWRSHRIQASTERITDNASDVYGLQVSDDGMEVFFATDRRRSDMKSIVDRESRRGILIGFPPIYTFEDGPRWPSCSEHLKQWGKGWGPEISAIFECKPIIWVVDVDSRRERRATDVEADKYFKNMKRGANIDNEGTRHIQKQSPSGKHLAYFASEIDSSGTAADSQMRLTATIDGQTVQCPSEECVSSEPVDLWWHRDDADVVFLVKSGPRNTLTSLHIWNLNQREVRTVTSSDDELSNCQKNDDQLICAYESWTSPRSIVAISLSNHGITKVVDENPMFQDLVFTRVEKILGDDAYGNPAHAHLVYPADYQEGKAYPLVIVGYRSGGFLRGGIGDEHPVHVLAQNGLAVLSYDTSDFTDIPGEFADPVSYTTRYLEYVLIDQGPATAIETMIDLLSEDGMVDPLRVGITGLSHGASVLESAILRRNYAAASTAYSWITSPPNLFDHPDHVFIRAMDRAFGGTAFSEKGWENRAKYSIGINASEIDTPLLIQAADREYYLTAQNYHALKQADKVVELYLFPNEYHVKWQPVHRYNVYRRNLQWFLFWLQDKAVDDPVDSEQYERWRKMRDKHCVTLGTQDAVASSIYCH